MRFLLIEAMKEEKRRGLLTEHEINEKYKNSFSYQTSRYYLLFVLSNSIQKPFIFIFRSVQCGPQARKTVVPSDSGYLTTEGSEKTLGDVCRFYLL